MKFGPGVGTEENPGIRIFQNGAPIYMNQKPEIITKNVNINIDKVLTGCSIPLDIERWILENGIKVFEKITIYINIEKGIDNNEIILLHNQGHVINNSCKGDIKIFIQIINNTEFERNGLDLIIHKKISLKESLCGFQFELKYINDKIYTIHNHSGNIITPEYQKIIPNMGLTRENHVGNLIIHFHIEFPLSLSPEKIALLTDIL
jgi:DnaJ-class molecular chaperone